MPDIPVNSAQTNLPQLMDEVAQFHRPSRITGAKVNAVLLSEGEWASIQETLYLLSVPNMRESIKAGLATPIEDCAGDLDW